MKATAAVARRAHAPLSIETLDLEEPRADEVLVRVVATGICHTDPAMRDGACPVPQPIVHRHEGSGVVLRTGSVVTSVASFCHDFFGRNFAGGQDSPDPGHGSAIRCRGRPR